MNVKTFKKSVWCETLTTLTRPQVDNTKKKIDAYKGLKKI